MKLRESVNIAADANAVWPYLVDPEMHAQWNPKVVSIERDRRGPVRLGERFEMIYRMSDKERQGNVEVTVLRHAQQVVYRHRGKEPGSTDRVAEESYEIEPRDGGVRVVQTIDIARLGIPFPVRWLMKLLHRFGTPKDEPYLNRLKRLVEDA